MKAHNCVAVCPFTKDNQQYSPTNIDYFLQIKKSFISASSQKSPLFLPSPNYSFWAMVYKVVK
jgi:hypothetical protein